MSRWLTETQKDEFDTTLKALRAKLREAETPAERGRLRAQIEKVESVRAGTKAAAKAAARDAGELPRQKLAKAVRADEIGDFIEAQLLLSGARLADLAPTLTEANAAEVLGQFAAEERARILRKAADEVDYWFRPQELPWPKGTGWIGDVLEAADGWAARIVLPLVVPKVEEAVLALVEDALKAFDKARRR